MRRSARRKPSPVVRLVSSALRSGSASSARTWDGAERDVDDPALHGQVGTPVVPLENLREGRPQGAQLLVLLGLNGLDLRGVAEALQQLAEPGLAFLRDLLPGREFPGKGRTHQLLGLRVADLHRTILQLLVAELSGGSRAPTPRSAESATSTSNFDERIVPAYTLCEVGQDPSDEHKRGRSEETALLFLLSKPVDRLTPRRISLNAVLMLVASPGSSRTFRRLAS